MYRLLPLIALYLMASGLTAQDTLSFGGVYELPDAEVRAVYNPVSRLASQFTIEEVYRLPGTFYDPARLVALLPGVVQTNDQANHLSVRGNTPNANLWRINGLAIVNPNHTANAGTFYDFPTLNGGGVNAISAQMLDNSGFFAGGLPVEYGYATGGTFDLRLRPGAKEKRKYQLQAGFIGFDGMAEGPVGQSGKTSYLINGRYSFTGLLADMGVDFGGEEIRFADINAHLHHAWDGGELSAFAVAGQSSNVFRFSAEEEVTEQKELTDIDFESDVVLSGLSFRSDLGLGEVKAGVGLSSTRADRNQRLREGAVPLVNQRVFNGMLTGNVSYDYPLVFGSVSVGSEVTVWAARLTTDVRRDTGGEQRLGGDRSRMRMASPFANYQYKGLNGELNVGLRATHFSEAVEGFIFEPRLSYNLRAGKSSFRVTADRISRPPMQAQLLEAGRVNDFVPVSNNFAVAYGRSFGGLTARLTGYYQYTDRDYAIEEAGFLRSANNFLELSPFRVPLGETATRRYGAELEAAGGRKDKGWYYRGSISLLRAESEQTDGSWSKDRYSVDYIANLTLGREWTGRDRKDRDRVYGLNLALIAHGGERFGELGVFEPSPSPTTVREFFAPQIFRNGFTESAGTYFRPDLRLYKTKTRPKTTTTLALDIQNAAGIENTANVYYDAFLNRPNERFQLGLIPVLSYRIVWR